MEDPAPWSRYINAMTFKVSFEGKIVMRIKTVRILGNLKEKRMMLE
jgi:hypothetical protein